MEQKLMDHVRAVLTDYLEANSCRKTPERYAILEAVYSQKGRFTLQELNEILLKNNFRVSRATLYNAMKLFLALRLVVKHVLPGGTYYEAGYRNGNHCHRICTECGRSDEIRMPQVVELIGSTKIRRFHQDGFILYIYGVCSSCQAKMSRRKASAKKKTTKKKK
ncbi:MAG: transcriptional repressor [Prevotella sp.]|nr:transcriptional repressor [Prevotella sp.]